MIFNRGEVDRIGFAVQTCTTCRQIGPHAVYRVYHGFVLALSQSCSVLLECGGCSTVVEASRSENDRLLNDLMSLEQLQWEIEQLQPSDGGRSEPLKLEESVQSRHEPARTSQTLEYLPVRTVRTAAAKGSISWSVVGAVATPALLALGGIALHQGLLSPADVEQVPSSPPPVVQEEPAPRPLPPVVQVPQAPTSSPPDLPRKPAPTPLPPRSDREDSRPAVETPKKSLPAPVDERGLQIQLAIQFRGDETFEAGASAHKRKDYATAIANWECCLENRHREEIVANNLAWVFATCPDSRFRDGVRAVQLCEQHFAKDEISLTWIRAGTMAAAFAEARQFGEASRYQEISYRLSPSNKQAEQLKKLDLYRRSVPYRESSPELYRNVPSR